MSEKAKRWIEAGKLFAEDANAKVLCPECENVNLSTIDIVDVNDSQRIERAIFCSSCGAKNYLRLKNPNN